MNDDLRQKREKEAQHVYLRIKRLTNWRDAKIRFWLDQANPLLGMVTPIWMIQQGKVAKLLAMIDIAEQDNALYRAQYGSATKKKPPDDVQKDG